VDGDEVDVVVLGVVTPEDVEVEVDDGVTDGGYQWVCVCVCCEENSFTAGT